MGIKLAAGSQVAIAATYAAAQTFSSISNAAEAVASFASNPSIVVNDIVEVTSGWDRLNQRMARVKAISGAGPFLVTLEQIDTQDTAAYPAGAGAGTVRKVLTWSAVTQVQQVASSGGEINYVDTTTLADFTQKQVPNTRSPVNVTFTLFDDPSLPYYSVVRAAAESRSLAALRIVLPGGSTIYAAGYWSLQTTPNLASGQAITANLDVTFAAEPTRYA